MGRPGAAVLEALAVRADQPGQEALADRLAGRDDPGAAERASAAAALADRMPVQPEGATATRDILLGAAQDYQLRDWEAQCRLSVLDDTPGCLMVVADLLPARPGEEAILILDRGGFLEALGLYLGDDGLLVTRSVLRSDGGYLDSVALGDLLEAWRTAPPPLTPALLNQLGTGEAGLLIVP